MTNTTPFIVAEQFNGRATVHSAYICYGEADFISRISQVAARSDEEINTVEDAIDYLNEKHAQRTRVITQADFDEYTTDSWDTAVLEKAQELGWYEPAEEGEE